MKGKPGWIVAAMCAAATPILAQEQVRFTGETTAGDQLINDAFQNIALYVRKQLNCQNIELVEAEVLPSGAVKPDPNHEGSSPATYEQWTVTFCGKKQPFTVVFWEAKEGGTMFRIQLRPAE